MEDSRPLGLSEMRGAGCFVAHEDKAQTAPASRAQLAMRYQFELRIWSSINDDVPGLHLDATRQASGDNIANRCRRFNRRNANLSD